MKRIVKLYHFRVPVYQGVAFPWMNWYPSFSDNCWPSIRLWQVSLSEKWVLNYATLVFRRGSPPMNETSSPGEALSTFIRASRDPKGETQLRVANSTKVGLLTPKTMRKHFLNNSKTTLKKSSQNEQNFYQKSRFWTLVLKIQPKVRLLRLKTMPKHFLNNS